MNRPTFVRSHLSSQGTVRADLVAATSRAVYLRSDDGEIVWLCTSEAPMHRRAIRTSVSLARMRVGMKAEVVESRLFIDGLQVADLAASGGWAEPVLACAGAPSAELVMSRVRDAVEIASRSTVELPFLTLLDAAIDGNRPAEYAGADLFVKAAWPLVDCAVAACLSGTFSAIPPVARSLVGMGPGLTPSGDDLLGGIFFALSSLKRACPDWLDWNTDQGVQLVDTIGVRTNEISRAILGDLARGYGPEPLHRLANELLDAAGGGVAGDMVQALLSIGHRSGGDLLTGFLAGMLATNIDQIRSWRWSR